MDGLTLTAVVTELKRMIVGGRIEKVQQPERDELLIAIHSTGGAYRLLISASPENGRILLTDEKKQSPVDAPAFLMLLRKYLTGSRIASVEQPFGDRIVEFGIDAYSELRDRVTLTLVCEIMGRHSNIILLDGDRTVMDSIKRVGPSLSSARLVLPHVPYEYPPSKKKLDLKEASVSDFQTALSGASKPEAALSSGFYGLSPAVARLLIEALGYPSCGSDELSERLFRYFSDLRSGSFTPCVVTADARSVCPLPFEPKDGSEYKTYGSMSEAASAFYSSRAAEESLRRRTSSYEHVIKNAVQKLEKKLVLFEEAIAGAENSEKYRVYGELLTANLHMLRHKTDLAVVTDYYSDPPCAVEIPLDPKLSAADNAQKYFSKYRKAKLARDHAVEMSEQTAAELDYLEELLYTLSLAQGEPELNEIRQELIAGGYVQDDANRKKRAAAQNKVPASKPYSFVSRDGVNILVGKNNRQNDKLTLGIANPDDIWLHTKDAHGSHVIIKRSGKVPDSTLYDAAVLAAYYSKARGSYNVPVDFTEAKYVKKPSGAKPGMVIYTHQKTVFVTPDADHIKSLMQ